MAKDCNNEIEQNKTKKRQRMLLTTRMNSTSLKTTGDFQTVHHRTIKFKNGPSTVETGFTHASVSANTNPLPEVIATPTVSESEEAIVGSIIDKEEDVLVAMGDMGGTKADVPLIIVAIAQHKTATRRYMLIVLYIFSKIESEQKGIRKEPRQQWLGFVSLF